MGRKYKFYDSSNLYFVSFATVNWIDVFTRRLYSDILVESLKYCVEHKGLNLYAWCIMTNHVHLIINSDTETLSDILRDFKRHTSKSILEAIENNVQESRKEWMLFHFERAGARNSRNEKYQFWQQNNQPILLDTKEKCYQRLAYLHNNPVAAGFVEKPEDYLYSSAKNYVNLSGLIEVI